MKIKNSNGYTLIYALLLVVIAATVGFIGWYVYHTSSVTNSLYANSGNVAAKNHPYENKSDVSGLAVLSGTVTQGPATPVCQSFATCANPVAGHTIQAIDSGGQVAASTKTDSKGKYSLHLKPGTYTLNLDPKIGLGVIKNNQVTVHSGTNTFNLEADSGIR
jgi:hypothetical protein